MWADAGECGSDGAGAGILCLLPAARLMTSNDGNDLTPAQEKLEWVTPKISLMDAGDTDSRSKTFTSSEIASGVDYLARMALILGWAAELRVLMMFYLPVDR